MFSSTLLWCLGLVCVLGIEAAIVWEVIPETERQPITTCIINSKRLESTNTMPLSVTNKQKTQSSQNKNKFQGPATTEVELTPKITPICQFTIEWCQNCRLVVSSYEAKGFSSHFFAALVFDGKLGHVTRLGSIWKTSSPDPIPLKKDEAKSQAEHYYLWTPYLCKEKWQQVDQSVKSILKVANEDYTLKWFWPVIEDNMVEIYCGPDRGPGRFAKYTVAIGQQLNTSKANLISSSKPGTLAEIEAEIEKALSGEHPFLAKEWLEAEQLKLVLVDDLNDLTNFAANEAKVDSSNMTLKNAKVVTTCKGLICIFYVQCATDQQSSYVLAGGFHGKNGFEMTMYINMGNVMTPIEDSDEHVKNHYTLAFSSNILPTAGFCQWPWRNIYPYSERPVSHENLKQKVAENAPFTVNLQEMYAQKIVTENYGDTCGSYYETAAHVIYGYKGRFFTAAFKYIRHNGEWETVHVSGLMFAEHLEKEITRCQKEDIEKVNRGGITAEEVFPKIQKQLPNITGWKEELIPKMVNENVIEQHSVVAPVTPRNAALTTDWYYFIFRITIINPEKLEDRGLISYKYFSVFVVDKGEDIIIVEVEGKKTWFREVVAKDKLMEFLKKRNADAISEL